MHHAAAPLFPYLCYFSSLSQTISRLSRILICCGRKRTGETDLLRTDFCTVITGDTRNQRDPVQFLLCFFQNLLLILSQSLEVLHIGQFILHLLHITHSRQNGNHTFWKLSLG